MHHIFIRKKYYFCHDSSCCHAMYVFPPTSTEDISLCNWLGCSENVAVYNPRISFPHGVYRNQVHVHTHTHRRKRMQRKINIMPNVNLHIHYYMFVVNISTILRWHKVFYINTATIGTLLYQF